MSRFSIPRVTNNPLSFARESMHLQIARDALSNEDVPDEVLARELALDKELVQLIQTACKNDKLPRALELTNMLHHTSSFDMALKVAGFYRLVGLQEKMEALKDDRIARGKPQRRDWARDYDPVLPPRLPPADIPRGGESKAFQHFGPPAAVHRPGLARATPSLPPMSKDDVFARNDDHAPTKTAVTEGKRKWVDDDVVVTHGDAVDDEYAAGPPSKPSAHVQVFFVSIGLTSQLTEANPFAKRPGGVADSSRNPFARDNPNNKSLHKSESFFDKAEAAETGKWKGPSRFSFLKY